MNRDEVIIKLKEMGFTRSRGINLYKPEDPDFRASLRKCVVRFERNMSKGHEPHWVMILHGYYKTLSIRENGKFCGLKRPFGGVNGNGKDTDR